MWDKLKRNIREESEIDCYPKTETEDEVGQVFDHLKIK